MALECPPFSDFVILLVDFNAYRGNDTETRWGVTGRNGLPNVVLLDFWANNGLSIINTMFEQKGAPKCTWHQDTLVAGRGSICNQGDIFWTLG